MAEWEYKPTYTYEIEQVGYDTLIDEFEDGGVVRREKANVSKKRYRERHRVNGADLKLRLDFFDTKRLIISLTRLHYDSQLTPLGEMTAFFNAKWRSVQLAKDFFEVEFEFVEDIT